MPQGNRRLADAKKFAVRLAQPQYERRMVIAHTGAELKRAVADEEVADWRLAAAFPEPMGLTYILIYERQLVP